MFSGIVEATGTIIRIGHTAAGARLTLTTSVPLAEVGLGESICVNGTCLTVTAIGEATLSFDVSAESLRRSTLCDLALGDAVNLERAMRRGDRLGGHMVSGHLDGTGEVQSIRPEGESQVLTFRVDAAFMPMIVEKGSIAVDGTSLTCFACRDGCFDVAVIPHTLEVTTLGMRRPGARVNIELDVMGKYVARLVDAAIAARIAAKTASS